MSVTGNKMRTDCTPCRRRFRYRRIRWDTWEQDRADAFESVLISSPRKWGLRVAHNALSLRQADRADSEDHVTVGSLPSFPEVRLSTNSSRKMQAYRSVSMNTSQPISPSACLILFFALSAAV